MSTKSNQRPSGAFVAASWTAMFVGMGALRRPGVVRWMDRLTGALFVGFGVRLAWSARP